VLVCGVVLALAEPAAGAPPRQVWDAPARGHATGVVLVIHGGGWLFTGPVGITSMRTRAARMRERGWATERIDYRAGARGLGDVVRAYDDLRARVGPRLHVCAYGTSAGAHLALMLAHRRPSLRCVIAEAALTDLPRLEGFFLALSHQLFDPFGGLPAWSPARLTIHQPVLLVHARCDGVVPYRQALAFRAAHRATTTLVRLEGGERTDYTHCPVAAHGVRAWFAAERRFLRANATPGR